MDSDGNINPHKKIFKRTLAPSAEDVHQEIVMSSDSSIDTNRSEAEAINALAEEVVSMAKPHGVSSIKSTTLETDSGDRSLMEEHDSVSSPTNDVASTSPEEVSPVVEPVATEEPVPEPTAPAETIESATPVSPEPIASLETQPEPVFASTAPEPLADVDTILTPEPILTSDTPAEPASSSPEPVAVTFSSTTSVPVTFSPSAPETSADSATPAPSPAPIATTVPAPSDASSTHSTDTTVSQGIINTPPKSSPITTFLIIALTCVLLGGLGFLAYIIFIEPQSNQNLATEPVTPLPTETPTDQSLVCILPSSSDDSDDSDDTLKEDSVDNSTEATDIPSGVPEGVPNNALNSVFISSYQKISLNYHESTFQDLLIEKSYSYKNSDSANKKLDSLKSNYESSLKNLSLTLDPFYSSFLVDSSTPSTKTNEKYSAIESHYVTADELTAKNAALIDLPQSSATLTVDLDTIDAAYTDLGYSCETKNKLLTLTPDSELKLDNDKNQDQNQDQDQDQD